MLTNVLTGRLGYRSVWRSLFYNFPEATSASPSSAWRASTWTTRRSSAPTRCRGGEQQRVAIARALAQQPKVILADEPVASLDPKIARQVLGYLRRSRKELGITVLCNLHQVDYAREFAERIVGMSRGAVVFEGPAAELTDEVLHRIYYREPDAEKEEA